MTRGVDVLALMDSYVTHWREEVVRTSRNPQINNAAKDELATSTEARAAVAQLIEAVEGGRNKTFGRFVFDEHEANRLRAALARVRGAA